jgi:endonuclease/exonuclease/phosphatase family metal-dependent hydrolase
VAVKVAAWNVEGRLTDFGGRRGTPERIVSEIEQLDADVVALPEAYLETPADDVDEMLKSLGYEWYDTSYQDRERNEPNAWPEVHMRMLSRLPIHSAEQVRWGDNRTLPVITVADQESGLDVCFMGTHLDERSEALRQKQVDDMAPYIRALDMTTVALGDFNAAWHNRRAKLIGSRALQAFARRMPVSAIRSEASRVAEMMTGTTMERLRQEAGLDDIDPRHRPTVTPKRHDMPRMPSIPLAQIDHILVTNDIMASDFKVAPDGGSDHRAISATLRIKDLLF